MTLHRTTNIALAVVIAIFLSSAYLLDGPSELDAMQATADSVQDAIDLAATHAYSTGARGQKGTKFSEKIAALEVAQ